MPHQSRETLPVAVSYLERRKEIEEDIAYEIHANMNREGGVPADLIEELEQSLGATTQNISDISRTLLIGLEEGPMAKFLLEEPPLGASIEREVSAENVAAGYQHTTLPGMSRTALHGTVIIQA